MRIRASRCKLLKSSSNINCNQVFALAFDIVICHQIPLSLKLIICRCMKIVRLWVTMSFSINLKVVFSLLQNIPDGSSNLWCIVLLLK